MIWEVAAPGPMVAIGRPKPKALAMMSPRRCVEPDVWKAVLTSVVEVRFDIAEIVDGGWFMVK